MSMCLLYQTSKSIKTSGILYVSKGLFLKRGKIKKAIKTYFFIRNYILHQVELLDPLNTYY